MDKYEREDLNRNGIDDEVEPPISTSRPAASSSPIVSRTTTAQIRRSQAAISMPAGTMRNREEMRQLEAARPLRARTTWMRWAGRWA